MNYARIQTGIWSSDLGIRLSKRKSTNIQLMAFYLMSNKHANLTGAYYLPIGYIYEDISTISFDEIEGLINCLQDDNFCKYDFDNKYVWVKKMMKYQVGEKLSDKDSSKIIAVSKYTQEMIDIKVSFIDEFCDEYMQSHRIEI